MKEHRLAGFSELNESIYTMGVVGLVFGSFSKFAETSADANAASSRPISINSGSKFLDVALGKLESFVAYGDRLADQILGPRPQFAFAMTGDNSAYSNGFESNSRPNFSISEPLKMQIVNPAEIAGENRGAALGVESAEPKSAPAEVKPAAIDSNPQMTEARVDEIIVSRLDYTRPLSEITTAIRQMLMNAPKGGDAAEFGSRLIEASGSPDLHNAFIKGVQRGFTVVYEPNRNVYLYPDGSYRAAMPTPSGATLMLKDFGYYGCEVHRGYLGASTGPTNNTTTFFAEKYSGDLNVISTGTSRSLNVGMNQPYQVEFMPPAEIVNAVRANKPVDVSVDLVRGKLGTYVGTTKACNGWLLGFDRISGEALVTLDDNGGLMRGDKSVAVSDLTGFYPVEMKSHRGDPYTVLRDSLGHIYKANPVDAGFQLREFGAFAFPPSEVWASNNLTFILRRIGRERLSDTLGLNSSVGLRALGGFFTVNGGRIPIDIPAELQAKPQGL